MATSRRAVAALTMIGDGASYRGTARWWTMAIRKPVTKRRNSLAPGLRACRLMMSAMIEPAAFICFHRRRLKVSYRWRNVVDAERLTCCSPSDVLIRGQPYWLLTYFGSGPATCQRLPAGTRTMTTSRISYAAYTGARSMNTR